MTSIDESISKLYEKDISEGYKNLQELEALSEKDNSLYPYIDEFISMLGSDKYVVRVRGFRLLCKQAQWDDNRRIDNAIDKIMAFLNDDKPTAVRQALKSLEDVVIHKKNLCASIKATVMTLDYSHFKDTMRPLIEKDIHSLLLLITNCKRR